MDKPRCPHCERPAPIRVEAGDGRVYQTVQCLGCRQVYRVVVLCKDDRCAVSTEYVDPPAA